MSGLVGQALTVLLVRKPIFFRLLRTRDAAYIHDVLYNRTAQADGVRSNIAKSFEQIRSKRLVLRLVLRLSRLDVAEREALLKRVENEGLQKVMDPIRDHVGRDAARRNIKHSLVGRTWSGDEMLEMAGDQRVT